MGIIDSAPRLTPRIIKASLFGGFFFGFRVDIQELGIALVKREVAWPVIQAIAGHRDIRTTMRYIHVVGADIDWLGREHRCSRCHAKDQNCAYKTLCSSVLQKLGDIVVTFW